MIQAATPKELADAVRRTLKAHRFQMEDATRLGMARDNLKAGNACAALYALEAVERKLQEKLTAVRGLCRKTAETITGEEAGR